VEVEKGTVRGAEKLEPEDTRERVLSRQLDESLAIPTARAMKPGCPASLAKVMGKRERERWAVTRVASVRGEEAQ
jgi:hypothetical protein